MTIDTVTFEHLTEKGIYVEQLEFAELTNLTMSDVGQYGRADGFGDIGQWGAGIFGILLAVALAWLGLSLWTARLP